MEALLSFVHAQKHSVHVWTNPVEDIKKCPWEVAREKRSVCCILHTRRPCRQTGINIREVCTVVHALRRLLDQTLVISVTLMRSHRGAVQRHICKNIDKRSLKIRKRKAKLKRRFEGSFSKGIQICPWSTKLWSKLQSVLVPR